MCDFIEDTQEVIVTKTTDLTNEEIVNNAKKWNMFSIESMSITSHDEIKSRITALNNLKFHTNSLNQNSQLSNGNYQLTNNIPVQTTAVKNVFIPKTPVAHDLIKNYCNTSEEPPAKRLKNEESKLKTVENYSNNEKSIIENIFEGIDEEEMFNDFCC